MIVAGIALLERIHRSETPSGNEARPVIVRLQGIGGSIGKNVNIINKLVSVWDDYFRGDCRSKLMLGGQHF